MPCSTSMVEVVREIDRLGEVVARMAGEMEGEASELSFRCTADYNPHHNSVVMKYHLSLQPRTRRNGGKKWGGQGGRGGGRGGGGGGGGAVSLMPSTSH